MSWCQISSRARRNGLGRGCDCVHVDNADVDRAESVIGSRADRNMEPKSQRIEHNVCVTTTQHEKKYEVTYELRSNVL